VGLGRPPTALGGGGGHLRGGGGEGGFGRGHGEGAGHTAPASVGAGGRARQRRARSPPSAGAMDRHPADGKDRVGLSENVGRGRLRVVGGGGGDGEQSTTLCRRTSGDGALGSAKRVWIRGENKVVGFIERARDADGRRRPAGGHWPSAGGQLGGGGTGRPQPPGQPDVRQRVGRQGARRYTRGSRRRRAGRTMTGTVAVLPAAPIPSIPGCAARLFSRLVHSPYGIACRVRLAWCTFSVLCRCFSSPLSRSFSASTTWGELSTREHSSSQRRCNKTR